MNLAQQFLKEIREVQTNYNNPLSKVTIPKKKKKKKDSK